MNERTPFCSFASFASFCSSYQKWTIFYFEVFSKNYSHPESVWVSSTDLKASFAFFSFDFLIGRRPIMTSQGLPRILGLLFVLGFVAHQVLGQIQSGGYGTKIRKVSLFDGGRRVIFDGLGIYPLHTPLRSPHIPILNHYSDKLT